MKFNLSILSKNQSKTSHSIIWKTNSINHNIKLTINLSLFATQKQKLNLLIWITFHFHFVFKCKTNNWRICSLFNLWKIQFSWQVNIFLFKKKCEEINFSKNTDILFFKKRSEKNTHKFQGKTRSTVEV